MSPAPLSWLSPSGGSGENRFPPPISPSYPRHVQRHLIAAGLAILVLGLLWPWLSKLPLGRLPGDLMIERPGFRFYAPFTTMIVVGLVLCLIIWLWRR